MGLFDRHPELKKAVANQYQAILVAGAAAFSAITFSPLPLLVLAGAELMVLPFAIERLKRRIAIEKKHASRKLVALTQEQQFDALPQTSRARYERLRQLCGRVQENYLGLSPESQGLIADQATKFEAVLASCLRRLWLLHKYDDMAGHADPERLARDVEELRREIDHADLAPRVREALEKNLEIKIELGKALERNDSNRAALAAELDSLEALLQLLLQKSVAATDPTAFSAEIDDVLAQIEADAASVEEMERLISTLPDRAADKSEPLFLSKLRQSAAAPETPRAPAPPPRTRQKR